MRSKNSFIKLLSFLMVIVFAIACEDPYEKEEFAAYDDAPIGLYLKNNSEYSLWVEMLDKVDVYNALNLRKDIEFTVFAPKNDAVKEYLKENNFASISDIDSTQLSLLVKYHILPQCMIQYSDLLGKLPAKTASNVDITVNIPEDGSRVERYIGDSKIIDQDNILLNGVLHGVDKVLQPVLDNCWDKLQNPAYSIFTEALSTMGLQEWLERREVMVGEKLSFEYKTL